MSFVKMIAGFLFGIGVGILAPFVLPFIFGFYCCSRSEWPWQVFND